MNLQVRQGYQIGSRYMPTTFSDFMHFRPVGVGSALCASNSCDEISPPHGVASYSITSVARSSVAVGTSMPSAFAVLRLRTISMRVERCTGRSAGFSPLRMRPA
jgi:hypothetical protein